MLTECGQTYSGGGEHRPRVSDAVEASAGLDALVLEVSSFHWKRSNSSTRTSVLLNITPDHLDRYESWMNTRGEIIYFPEPATRGHGSD